MPATELGGMTKGNAARHRAIRHSALYAQLYMTANRIQIYLTPRQRAKLDEVVRREHKSMAQVVQDALDAYFSAALPDADVALASTFGCAPTLSTPPREEWQRD
jgi:hypothetical protein